MGGFQRGKHDELSTYECNSTKQSKVTDSVTLAEGKGSLTEQSVSQITVVALFYARCDANASGVRAAVISASRDHRVKIMAEQRVTLPEQNCPS